MTDIIISLCYWTHQAQWNVMQYKLLVVRGAKQGGLGGLNPPLNFGWGGGLNTCQPPLILRIFF